eukprot:TRINITY_DN19759_c0_g1_i1.p1 TRINITY_DN19759_c0_g1~~TRINITY_DN19759_c0_g1_i1.p1  ORF type:complete len:178 (-),score=3.36 TRINITY_DN19759_c0_g1_i1:47-580(-)
MVIRTATHWSGHIFGDAVFLFAIGIATLVVMMAQWEYQISGWWMQIFIASVFIALGTQGLVVAWKKNVRLCRQHYVFMIIGNLFCFGIQSLSMVVQQVISRCPSCERAWGWGMYEALGLVIVAVISITCVRISYKQALSESYRSPVTYTSYTQSLAIRVTPSFGAPPTEVHRPLLAS